MKIIVMYGCLHAEITSEGFASIGKQVEDGRSIWGCHKFKSLHVYRRDVDGRILQAALSENRINDNDEVQNDEGRNEKIQNGVRNDRVENKY